MKGLACISFAALLDRRASGLSEIDLLRLEQHLSACDPCRREADVFGVLGDLSEHATTTLTPRARARAFDRAFAAAAEEARPSTVASPSHASPFVAAGAAFAVAAAVGLAWWAWPSDDATVAEGPRVVEGAVEASGEPFEAGDDIDVEDSLRTERGAGVVGNGGARCSTNLSRSRCAATGAGLGG